MLRDISIRTKLLILLLAFTLMALVLVWLSNFYEGKKQRVVKLTEHLTEIEVDVLNGIKAQSDFIIHEPINSRFFETGESKHAQLNDSLSAAVSNKLKRLANNTLIKSLELNDDFLQLRESQEQYNKTFNELADYVWLRGYKDFGLEGEMREYAHTLEDEHNNAVDLADILMLRRHEKDFIIRREEKYVLRFEYQCELIKYKLLLNKEVNGEKREKIDSLIDNYQKTFKELVLTEKRIGLKESSGLKKEVDHNARMFLAEIDELKSTVTRAQGQMLATLGWYYTIGIVLFILLSLWGSYKLSKNMTVRIKSLTSNLNNFVQSNFKEATLYKEEMGNDEVGELARNFKVLEDEIVIHFGLYRQKVERRTNEILQQKDELEEKQAVIEQKNKDILDSIKYAKKIQDSILPEERYLNQLLKDYFVLYKPKDIVSGDFYWVERTTEKIFVAVSDCTGHGVPGAFMSIMGHNFLNQAVNEKNLTQPDQILSYMNIAISSSLGQNHSANGERDLLVKVQDGMDIALITLDYSKNELMFSGAQRPLILTRNGKMNEYKGDRFPVGGSSYGEIKRFTLQTIDLQTGDNLYLFSDGYADQFGGSRNKKFKYSKLRDLLLTISSDETAGQKELLNEAHTLWKGEREQVDDICIFGIKI